eukprot:COSAG06_NODE_10161_length_1738_cov_1.133618_2_plen_234_part_00
MVGNLICRPLGSRLFGAAVCQVPLLDMKRYSHLLAGASWMGEYGDPDKPEEWKFLRTFSPYQMLRHDILGRPELGPEGVLGGETESTDPSWQLPKTLFTTSTRDDRVHPGHLRKMVASLIDEAGPEKAPTVLAWENTEGGHGGAPRFGLGAGQQFLLEGDSSWKNFRNTTMLPEWDRGPVEATWNVAAEPEYSKIADLRRICPEVDEPTAVEILGRSGGDLRGALREVLVASL